MPVWNPDKLTQMACQGCSNVRTKCQAGGLGGWARAGRWWGANSLNCEIRRRVSDSVGESLLIMHDKLFLILLMVSHEGIYQRTDFSYVDIPDTRDRNDSMTGIAGSCIDSIRVFVPEHSMHYSISPIATFDYQCLDSLTDVTIQMS
jgi:hypothetical protein